jgi:signal transduction histidine kinase
LNASETSIQPFVKEIIGYFEQHAALKQITIILKDELKEENALWIDRQLMTTVFYNLLSNAIKFTPGGGEIQVRFLTPHFP